MIEFSDNAVITEGGNKISSNYLVYNILEQRINAQGSPEGDGKVRITYTPGRTRPKPAKRKARTPPTDAGEAGARGRRAMSILSVQDISKSYKLRKVVKTLSLEIKSGEVVGLLGPNGAGKTTAFYMIVGLIPADKGKILLDGHDLTALPMHRRARMGLGYLPQEASIFRKLTVEQNILAILENREELDRAGREQELENLLDELHVGHVRASLGISLSGGERRRVEIARALAANPLFVLLDEPFAGVDPISVLDIQRIIRHLCARDIGVLITDHNVRETLGICGRAYILSDGSLIASGTPEEILENQHVREVYLGQEFKL